MFSKYVTKNLARRTSPLHFKSTAIMKFVQNGFWDNLMKGYFLEGKEYSFTGVSSTIYYDCLSNASMHHAFSSAQKYHSSNVKKLTKENIGGIQPNRIRHAPNSRRSSPMKIPRPESSKAIPYRFKFNKGQMQSNQAVRHPRNSKTPISENMPKPKRIKLEKEANAAFSVPLRHRSALVDSSYIGSYRQNRMQASYNSSRNNINAGGNGKAMGSLNSTATMMNNKLGNMDTDSIECNHESYDRNQGARWAPVPCFRDFHNEGYESPVTSSFAAITRSASNKNDLKNKSSLHQESNLMFEEHDKNWIKDFSSKSDLPSEFNNQMNLSARPLQESLKLKDYSYPGDYMSHSLPYSHLNFSNIPCAGDANSTQSVDSEMSSDSSDQDSEMNSEYLNNQNINGSFEVLRRLKVWLYPKEFLESFIWAMPKSSSHKVIMRELRNGSG